MCVLRTCISNQFKEDREQIFVALDNGIAHIIESVQNVSCFSEVFLGEQWKLGLLKML